MLAAGGRAVARRPGLVGSLYAVQLAVTLGTLIAVGQVLGGLYGHRPLFDGAVTGDMAALGASLEPHWDVIGALVWLGVALALAYGVASWFLTAGLLGALRAGDGLGRREVARAFGAAGAARFFAFARLWLWSIIPYIVALVVLAVGVGAGPGLREAMTLREAVVPAVIAGIPGMALCALVSCAVDYARVALVDDPALGAGRALLRAFKLVLTRPRALAHYALYLGAWGGITALYVAATVGRPYAGPGGALAIFALRQIVAGARFLARVMTYAGQQAFSPPP